MGRRLAACLLSFVMTISMMSGSAEAALAGAGEGLSAYSPEGEVKKTGYYQPVCIELEPDELPEIYEEPKENASGARGAAAYHTSWDSYSTNYFYNLLGDDQRALWDKLDAMCREYLTGTETLTGIRQYSNLKNGLDLKYYFTKRVAYYNMTRLEVRNIEQMFIASNPQYYFLQTILFDAAQVGTGGYAYLTVNESFGNGAARKAATQNMQNVINAWMPQVNAQPTALLKEKKIHDLICEKVTYDPNYGTIGQNPYNQTAYSVFCTDTTVCAGYSQAMSLLCNAAGIDCASVTSEEHEWNIVRLNDSWYYVDCTWDDNIAEDKGMGSAYPYFNRSSRIFMSDDKESVVQHTPEGHWTRFLPDLIYDSGATLTEYGVIFTPSSTLSAPQIVASGDKANITVPAGATVYYTVDGGNPSAAFTRAKRYTKPFVLTSPCTVKAIAVKAGYRDSMVMSRQITPVYSVKLDAAGGYISKKSVQSQTKAVTYNAAVGKLVSPKRKGYAFLGWYTKRSGGGKLDAASKITASKTYYAHWGKIKKGIKLTVSSVKSNSAGALKVTVKKNSSASGYQIRYSLKKSMSSSKKKEVTETRFTFNNLKKGKTYYVQARVCQKDSVSGKKTYGPWSKARTVKIKKK